MTSILPRDMRRRLSEKVTMKKSTLATTLIVIILAFAITGFLAESIGRTTERADAYEKLETEKRLHEQSLEEIREETAKKAYAAISDQLPLVILLLTIGLAFGLGNGIALVRVKR